MKTKLKIMASVLITTVTIVAGCKKNETPQPSNIQSANTDNYSSMADFFAKNGVAAQTYTITGSVGGSFTTPQGTVVSIPANAFLNSLSQVVTGQVIITFKDIYKKSDMLLSNVSTNMMSGAPLKSAGEFFIKSTSTGLVVTLANTITIKQPLNGLPLDSNMHAFIKSDSTLPSANVDTVGWALANYSANLNTTATNYVFSLYQYNYPVDSGSWCNSDNSVYFSAYPQTLLNVQENDDPSSYDTYVYLLFKGLNSMVHIYLGNGYDFPYYYAPVGLQCTVVAVGVKGGKIYSSFTPITISANQTVNFSMTETTTAAFKAAVQALN